MKRHALKVGEPYAIKSSAIERDADGFFILIGDEPKANETRGTVAVVHIRGALCQFKGEGGDSYEAIEERVRAALSSDPKPSSVVLLISSPGGLVAGLNECVFRLQRMRIDSGVPLIAYIDELAASAAFALACACDRRFMPPSGIAGSIGTISTMVSQARRDEAEGLDFQIITSGRRKADGHPHAPITDDAVKAETARNEQLTDQFFGLAAKALRTSPRKLEALQAAIFVGESALKAGLVNAIVSRDEALAGLDRSDSKPREVAPNEGNVTDRRAKEVDKGPVSGSLSPQGLVTNNVRAGDQAMPVNLKALIAKTEAAIATERDPAQLRILEAKLGTFLARAEMQDDEDTKKAKAAKKAEEAKAAEEKAKKAAKAAGHRSKAAEYRKKAEEAEEEASKCEADDDEGSEEARKSAARRSTTSAAAEIVASQAGTASEALQRVEALEARAVERDRQALIGKLVAERRVTPGEAKKWAARDAGFWAQVEEMRPKALVVTTEEQLSEPTREGAADISAVAKQMVEADIKIQGLTGEAAQKYRETSYAAHRAAQAGGANGAGAY